MVLTRGILPRQLELNGVRGSDKMVGCYQLKKKKSSLRGNHGPNEKKRGIIHLLELK